IFFSVCLDGSPPGYALDVGFGCGSNNWLIYLQGGGWCNTTTECAGRAKGFLGSTLGWNKIYFGGIHDKNETFNPDFYNWNRVFVLYCDGSSFLGDVEEVDPQTNLHYRGSRIFNAVMEELLSKGMDKADNCLFPENLVNDVQTPLFLLESSFDLFQLKDKITPFIGGDIPELNNFLNSLTLCNATQLEVMQEFQKTFIQALQNLNYSPSRGMLIHTCYRHGHISKKEEWQCSCVVNNVTIAGAIDDWYFDRDCFQQIDPCVPRNCTSTLDFDAFNRKCIQDC
ncbi:protein notum homolog, partial [Phtheirospermum japonicum]